MYAEFYVLYKKYFALGMPSLWAVEAALLSIDKADLIKEIHNYDTLTEILFFLENNLEAHYSA